MAAREVMKFVVVKLLKVAVVGKVVEFVVLECVVTCVITEFKGNAIEIYA